ncbi:MAG: dihydrolipoyl dehydrogenase [Oscillospiraceae bacterium]|nr:dihydrolipoyl dehydrogenase [Oscillospiraceae bacterium]
MRYDLAIIGGGPGGYTAAEEAGKHGLSVVLFEADQLGGTCLNRGCIPTKALLHASELYQAVKGSESLGLRISDAGFDFEAIHERKNQVVQTLRKGIASAMKAAKVTVVNARARVTGVNADSITLNAEDTGYEASYLIVAAGSVPSIPPIPGSNLPGVYTSNDLLEGCGVNLRSLIIIGGGVIGCECASIYRNLGSEVTILEMMDHILPPMDREIAQRLSMYFRKQGISVSTGAQVTEISGVPGSMNVTYRDKNGNTCTCSGEGVLLAAGRKPALGGIFPDELLPASERGALIADEAGKTTAERIYVIGDARAGTPQLAHVAEAQGRNAVASILGKTLPVNLSVIPSCIYTSPEIASVGLTEDEAKAAGIPVKTKKSLTGANGKAVISQSESGYVKVITHAETDVILGAQLVCPRATDMISELTVAVSEGLTAKAIFRSIHPHPTFSEMIWEASAP